MINLGQYTRISNTLGGRLTGESKLQHPVVNFVIGVQDYFDDMSGPARALHKLRFDEQLASLPAAERDAWWESLQRPSPPGDREKREAYRHAIRDSVDRLRQQGVPTIFMAIIDESRLYPATQSRLSTSPQPRDKALLEQLQLASIAPLADEDIFVKRFMNGFTDIDDVRASPEMARYVTGQRRDGHKYDEAHYGLPTLLQHMQALGARQVSIMGGIAEYCITDNALGAAFNGLAVTILPELIAADRDEDWRPTPEHARTQQKNIEAALDRAVIDPQSRGYKASDAPALKQAREAIGFSEINRYIATLKTEPGLATAFNGPSAKPTRSGVKCMAKSHHHTGFNQG